MFWKVIEYPINVAEYHVFRPPLDHLEIYWVVGCV